jgi:plasmid stability protein|tara:strand:+ start:440 stop:598 length:159 start_codon:yes stop_codon:yes gene_type:complete
MNAEKWKSVVIAITTYKKLKARAVKNHRTISGEFTHILEQANKDERPPKQAS